MKAHKMPCDDPSCPQFVCENRNVHLAPLRQTANTEPMTSPKDGVSELEEALARWREDECPYHHEHGPWCDDAEKFAAEVRRYQALAPAVEAVVTPEEEKLIDKIMAEHKGMADAREDALSWAQATLTALNVGDVKSGSPLHLKLREVMIAYRAALAAVRGGSK